MPKDMNQAVREMLGSLSLQLCELQVMIEKLTEQLAEAKKAADAEPKPDA